MKKILFDTNVVLDVLLERQPHEDASTAVWAIVETGNAKGMLAAHAVTTIHYFIRKQKGNLESMRAVAAILRVFSVAPVDGEVFEEALQLPCSDFEDAVTVAAARLAGCDYIVTRDPRGFRGSPVRCYSPAAILPLVAPM